MPTEADIRALLSTVIIPDGVRYDGIQENPCEGSGDLLQFTDLAPGKPYHGATFYVPLKSISTVTLARACTAKRREFAAPSCPLPPLHQRAPRLYAGAEIHH